MDSKETHQQQQNRNDTAALANPTSTSQAVRNRSSVGAPSPRQPQPQQALMLNASPYTVATQQPWMQLGTEQRGTTRKDAPDGGDSGGGANAGPPAKRGRPPGSRTKNRRNALGGGGPLTAHVIDVNPGEDIAMKLMAFVNQEPRDVCILSASGTVSRAVFQTQNPTGIVRFEGLYFITSMSGTFSSTESNGTVTRTGNLYVTMAGPDHMVVGGCVGGGTLVAGSQVKVIVGINGPEGVKLSAASPAPGNVLSSTGGGGGPGLPQSQGPQRSSDSSEGNASTSLGNTTPQPPHHLPLWPGNFPQ